MRDFISPSSEYYEAPGLVDDDPDPLPAPWPPEVFHVTAGAGSWSRQDDQD